MEQTGAGAQACPILGLRESADRLGLCRPGFGSIGHHVQNGKPGLLNGCDRIIDCDGRAELPVVVARASEEGLVGLLALAELVLEPLAIVFDLLAEGDKILSALPAAFCKLELSRSMRSVR